jgi:hypothetical protein
MPTESSRFRVVVDANVLIRAILSGTGASALLLEVIRRRKVELVVSRTHLGEIHRVLCRPRFVQRYGITARRRKRLIVRLYTLAYFTHPTGHLALCRDPKDDYLIEMALLGRATHLISEDEDFHDDLDIAALLAENGVQLVRAGAFIRTLTSPG